MTFHLYPSSFPVDERWPMLEPHIRIFLNSGIPRETIVHDWLASQTFDSYHFTGWWRTWWFTHSSHFTLLKIMFPEGGWLVERPTNPAHMEFYTAWKTLYDQRQEDFKAKIRLQRIANGEILD